MDIKLFATVFATIFLAELGDKTQLATLLFASREGGALMTVFVAAALALVVAAGLGVAAGSLLAAWLDPRYLSWVAGTGFIAIGIATLLTA